MPRQFEGVLFPGIRVPFDKSDSTQRSTYWQGERFEDPTAQVLRSWITKDTTHFFDIGSNYGFFSCLVLSSSSAVQVHAFEPNPLTFELVQEIKARNGLVNLHAWNIGLGDEIATQSLHLGVVDSGHSTFGDNPSLPGTDSVDVSVKTFAQWAEEQGVSVPVRSSWIAKIDVEGFEMKVLRGMALALDAKAFQGVIVEMNAFTLSFCGSMPQDIAKFMLSHGYKEVGKGGGNAFFEPI